MNESTDGRDDPHPAKRATSSLWNRRSVWLLATAVVPSIAAEVTPPLGVARDRADGYVVQRMARPERTAV